MTEDKTKKYDLIMEELRQGKSLTQITKERKCCHNNLRKQLKKRYPKEYDLLIYGEIIKTSKDFQLRKIPNNQTNSNETNMTKEVKKYFIENFNFIEEVGIWNSNKSERLCIDLYNKEKDIGIEIYWRSRETIKSLTNKLFKYQSFIPNIYIVLIKNSKFFTKNRSYFFVQTKLISWGFKSIIFDINIPPPKETLTFPMETQNDN